MWRVLNQLIDGVALTGPILLVAISLSSGLASSRALNVATGAAYALTAIVAIDSIPTVGVAGFIVICLGMPIVLYLLIDSIVLSVQRRFSDDPETASFAATLGVSLILTAIAAYLTSSNTVTLPPTFLSFNRTWHLGGLQVTANDAMIVVAAGAVLAAFWYMLYGTGLGAQFRATASDPFLARTVGVKPNQVIRISWIVAGLLTGVATILLIIVQRSASSSSGDQVLLVPLAAVIAGGMGNPKGAAIVSLFFGVSTALLTLVTSSGGYQSALVFGILFVVLMIRPQVLFAEARHTRAY
jgi:branched-subunit amino acid ABC-type transport system permease component